MNSNQQQDGPSDSTLLASSENTLSHSEGVIESGIVAEARTLPLWQRRLVALIQSGVDSRDAAEALHVSWASVDRYTRDGGSFAVALAAAEAGVAIVGVETIRGLAVAHAGGMVVDAVVESRDRGNAPRDRLGNRRLVLEVAGAMPQRGLVTVNVQTDYGFSRNDADADTVDGVVIKHSATESDDTAPGGT